MPNTALAIEPVTSLIGAEISGSLDHAIQATLNDALDEYHALFFHGQDLDAQGIKRVTEVSAPLVRVSYINSSPEDPGIIAVLQEASEAKIASFGSDRHSNFSFLDKPPGGSALHALEVLPHGGDTLWASQTAAYERLSDDLKAQIEGKRAIHIGAPYGTKSPPKFEDKLSKSIGMTRGARCGQGMLSLHRPHASPQRSQGIVRKPDLYRGHRGYG